MSIGLKRNVVELADHNPEWKVIAAETIEQLWRIFGSAAKDIQHVGSTAIASIKAKPIIDIAVAVDNFTDVETLMPALEENGFMRRNWYDNTQMIFAVGRDVELDDRITTHFIHIVKTGSTGWYEYINFRDYLNAIPSIAREYEAIKVGLATANPYDKGREKYLAGKHDFIVSKINEAWIWADLNRNFVKIEPVTKGLSRDKKYLVETAAGRRMLLRVSDISELDRRKAEYGMMEQAYSRGVLTSEPLGFGLCHSGKSCYSLAGWLDGDDAAAALPRMSKTQQYAMGLKSGKMLQKIHTLPAPDNIEHWNERFERKVKNWIDIYKSKPKIHSEIGDMIIAYLIENCNALDSLAQTFVHGDYNIENLIVMPNGEIGVIDFNCYNTSYGEPWRDLDNMSWMPTMFPYFYTGQINGYFNGEPPSEFWNVFSYYLAYDALAALTDPYELNGIEDGTEIVNNILKWTDNFKSSVPSWYLKDFNMTVCYEK